MTPPSVPPRSARRPRGSFVVTAAVVVSMFTAVSLADAAPTTAVIHGCMSRTTGVVRVISATGTCGPNEIRFEWNQTGPAGPPGPPGPAAASVIGGSSDVLPNTATSFIAPFEAGHSATQGTVAQVMPSAGTVTNLHADTEVDPGTFICIGATCQANAWTLVVVRNGVETPMFCQIFGSTLFAARQPCVQTSTSVAFAAGDTMSIAVKPGNPAIPAASALHWTATFTPG